MEYLPRIISLSSRGSGVGKDTVAAHLVKNYGYNQFSFASELRRVVAADFPDAPRHYHEFAAHISPDKEWELKVNFTDVLIAYPDKKGILEQNKLYIESFPQSERFVVSDTRFPDELSFLKTTDAKLVNILGVSRRGIKKFDLLLDSVIWDYQLDNTSTIANLHYGIDSMMLNWALSVPV